LVEEARYERAAERATELVWAATAARHDPVVADATLLLLQIYGIHVAEHELALRWSRHASAATARLGEDPLRELNVELSVGSMFFRQREFDAARTHYERAYALSEAHGRALATTRALNNLGNVAVRRGEYKDALALYERALTGFNEHIGPHHPSTARALNNIAIVLQRLHRYKEAGVELERALAIKRDSLGPEHVSVASTLGNLANNHIELREFEEARARYEEAMRLFERALGAEHPSVASCLDGLGKIANEQRRFADAAPLFERALKIKTSKGLPAPTKAASEFGLARALWADPQQRVHADELARSALAHFEASPNATIAANESAFVKRWLAEREP
jgi:Tfp pilus assembly protein PilF